jgi:hypothetical protein
MRKGDIIMHDKEVDNSSLRPGGSTIAAIVITVTICLAGCQNYYSHLSDEQILNIMRQPENLPYNYWHGESKWKLTEDGSSMLNFGHLDFGRVFTEESDWGAVLGEIIMQKSRRLNKNPLLLVPLLDSKDPDVVLYALHCYEHRLGVLESSVFDDLRPLYSKLGILTRQFPDTRVRWKAFHLMTKMNWISTGDLAHALDDPSESVRLAAAVYFDHLDNLKYVMQFEKEIRLHRKNNIERDIHNGLVKLAIKHINDNHYNVRFGCAEALKSLIRKRELFHVEIENEPPDEAIGIDWMRESWWKRNIAQKQLQEWWQQNHLVHQHQDMGIGWNTEWDAGVEFY